MFYFISPVWWYMALEKAKISTSHLQYFSYNFYLQPILWHPFFFSLYRVFKIGCRCLQRDMNVNITVKHLKNDLYVSKKMSHCRGLYSSVNFQRR